MTTLHGSVTESVAADPDALFALITDINRLPEWNAHVHHIVEAPAELTDGSEWVIELRAMGSKWNSRARLQELDPVSRRFAHISCSDDGNPSFAYWTWELTPTDAGTRITVSWELQPKTFWRKWLLARIRHRQLKNEVGESLRSAAAIVIAGNSR